MCIRDRTMAPWHCEFRVHHPQGGVRWVESKAVPRLEDALERAREYARLVLGKPVARYVSGISGPSKTGDVEFQIVQGMHGPGRVHLILLEVAPGPEQVDGVSMDLLCS